MQQVGNVIISYLDEKINVLHAKTYKDEMGGTVTVWEDKKNKHKAWAAIVPLSKFHSSEEKFIKSGLSFAGKTLYRVAIRYKKSAFPDEKSRIKWKGKYYAIVSAPIILGRKQWVQFLMSEVSDDQ